MGFQEYLIGTILIALFAFAMISYVYQTSTDNNAVSVLNNPALNRTFKSMNDTLSGLPTLAKSQQNATASEPATIGFGSIILFSIKSMGTLFTGTIAGIYNIINVLLIETLDFPKIVLGAIGAMVLIVAILLAWRIYRSGY